MKSVDQRESAEPSEDAPEVRAQLRISSYDNAAAMLLSLLMLVGITVAAMLLTWLTLQLATFKPTPPVTLTEIQEVEGEGMGPGEGGSTLDEPLAEELGEDVDLPTPQAQRSFGQLVDSIASQQSDIIESPLLYGFDEPGRGGSTGGRGRGYGSGVGDGGGGTVPRAKRWEIEFEAGRTIDLYGKQLDFFGIELGVIGLEEGQVIYINHLGEKPPQVRRGPAGDEKRLYMTWQRGALYEADRKLAERAGITVGDAVLVQFYSAETEQRLMQLERQFRNRTPEKIRKTRFGVRAAGGGYEFFVVDQVAA